MKIFKENGMFYMQDGDRKIEVQPNRDYYLKLPANSCNRVWVSCRKIDNAPGQLVDYGDKVMVPRVLGPYTRREKKPLEEYLNDEDKAKYLELVEKAKAAKAAIENRPLTPIEKAQREYEKWQAVLEKLKKGE